MSRRTTPKQFSAYVVTWSDEPSMQVGSVLVDKGANLQRDWNLINFETGKETGAVGHRLSRLCPDCRVEHGRVGILGHDGECGTDEVKEEARQVLADAKKRVYPPASGCAVGCGHPPADHDERGHCMHLCDCALEGSDG